MWAELIGLAEPAFSVDIRTDWPSAMMAILSKRPWAVIADLKRASLDSLTAVASIRAVLGDSSPIMIALSADLFELEGLRREFDFAFAKPVDVDSLMKALVG